MKFLAVLLSVATVAVALEDWSHLIPRDIYPPGFEPALGSAPGRIVGGTQAKTGDFPYQAALNIDDKYFCGGSLIRTHIVLTAAHCVDGANSVTVRLGVLGSGQGTQAANVQTIELASDASNTYAGVIATASGWGTTSDIASGISPNLMSVDLPVITNAQCASTYGSSIVTAGNICINGSGGKSTCNGDSGGPLVVGSGNSRVLIGITSFGSSAGCQRGYPAAFARVTYFRNWILNKIG